MSLVDDDHSHVFGCFFGAQPLPKFRMLETHLRGCENPLLFMVGKALVMVLVENNERNNFNYLKN